MAAPGRWLRRGRPCVRCSGNANERGCQSRTRPPDAGRPSIRPHGNDRLVAVWPTRVPAPTAGNGRWPRRARLAASQSSCGPSYVSCWNTRPAATSACAFRRLRNRINTNTIPQHDTPTPKRASLRRSPATFTAQATRFGGNQLRGAAKRTKGSATLCFPHRRK
jgi:hypothetical protein